MTKLHTVILAIDGLRASALGAYGNTTYSTPAFDQLASRSLLFDFVYADASDLQALCPALWSGVPIGGNIAQNVSPLAVNNGYYRALLTDDASVLELPASEEFDAADLVQVATRDATSDNIGETTLAETFGELSAQLSFRFDQSRDGVPLFAWLHTIGLNGAWDAPTAMAESLLGEDDPPMESQCVDPATGPVDSGADEAFHACCRYAAQIMVLDACLDGFIDFLGELFADESYQLVLLGSRGYALGEHGVLGGDDQRLYSEMHHVPLMMFRSERGFLPGRISTPCNLSQSIMHTATAGDEVLACPSGCVIQVAPQGGRAIHTGEWRLIDSASKGALPQLFLKPDDRWEQNDVASLKPDVVDEMLAMLSKPH